MQYLVTFLEGIATFVSPCLLPMLPLYLAYFAGDTTSGADSDSTTRRLHAQTVLNACGFVCGITIVFVSLGALAGWFGQMLSAHQLVVNIVCGAIVIIFGIDFAGIIHIPLLDRTLKPHMRIAPSGFFKALAFGIVFSIGWTPCVGAFLGSALLLASSQASVIQGVLLLVCYSVGLGVPYIASALVIDQLSGAFDFIKRNYTIITRVCGALLIIMGVCIMTGVFQALMTRIAMLG